MNLKEIIDEIVEWKEKEHDPFNSCGGCKCCGLTEKLYKMRKRGRHSHEPEWHGNELLVVRLDGKFKCKVCKKYLPLSELREDGNDSTR